MLLCYYRKNMHKPWTKTLTQLTFAWPTILVFDALVYSSAAWGTWHSISENPSAIKRYVYVCFIHFINEETTHKDESSAQSYTASKCQCQHPKKGSVS